LYNLYIIRMLLCFSFNLYYRRVWRTNIWITFLQVFKHLIVPISIDVMFSEE